MEKPNAIVVTLVEFARDHDLIARAKHGCAVYLENSANDGDLPPGSESSDLRMEFRSHSLTFESSLLGYPYIATLLNLYVGDKEVGWYKLIVCLDGRVDDDYLVFYPTPGEDRG
jgi:hypothetical protein